MNNNNKMGHNKKFICIIYKFTQKYELKCFNVTI